MTLYVLDTDHLSLLQRGHPALLQRFSALPPEQLATTVVTAEEQFRGRLAQINKIPSGPARIEAYQHLRKAIADLCKLNVLPYDAAADRLFLALKRQHPRLGSQDLRIAAITLTHQGTLATRNLLDFGQLPNLAIENWAS